MPSRKAIAAKRKGRPFRRARGEMFASYGRFCYLCGHAGAGEAGHVVALAVDPDQPVSPHRMRPVHGSRSRCLECGSADGKGRACNQEQGVTGMDEMFTPKLVF